MRYPELDKKHRNVDGDIIRCESRDLKKGGEGGGRGCITANGNILASGNLCFRVFNHQLKVINKNIYYLYSV